ncbi:MAG: Zinc metalloprotease, partial [uncultured Acetobacteraceae bacterium]
GSWRFRDDRLARGEARQRHGRLPRAVAPLHPRAAGQSPHRRPCGRGGGDAAAARQPPRRRGAPHHPRRLGHGEVGGAVAARRAGAGGGGAARRRAARDPLDAGNRWDGAAGAGRHRGGRRGRGIASARGRVPPRGSAAAHGGPVRRPRGVARRQAQGAAPQGHAQPVGELRAGRHARLLLAAGDGARLGAGLRGGARGRAPARVEPLVALLGACRAPDAAPRRRCGVAALERAGAAAGGL